MITPRSYRFCVECMQERLYIYSEKEGHSICKVCNRPTISINLENKKMIHLVKIAYLKGREDTFKSVFT